jgi:parvulin-like peptidyl-prolyl isomerase
MCGRHRLPLAPLALVPILALSLAACGRGEDDKGPVSKITGFVQAKLKPGPVLRVEAKEFTNQDFQAYLKAMGAGETADLSPESLSRLFDKFVDDKLMLEAARRMNITVTWDEKKNYIAKRTRESAGDEAAAAGPDAPADSSGSDILFDRLLVEKYTYQVVRDVRVEESEIRDYYEKHKKDFLLPERVQVSQILVPTEEKAVAVRRKVENAPAEEFRRLAREESTGPEAARGGLMGVYRPGDLPAEMEKVIFALEAGQISRVVESSYGYHVFRLDQRLPPHLESEEEASAAVRVRVLEDKVKEALAAHLGGLRDTLGWKIFPENLFFAYQRLDG